MASPARAAESLYVWQDVSAIKAPVAAMEMENGEKRTLADFKGQVVLLNLWATWCTPCLKELPTLDKLEEQYMGEGLVVIPLSLDRFEFKQLRAFVDKQKLELPHLAQDSSGAFNRALVKNGVPLSYLIDREGKLTARYSGATNWMAPDMRTKIEAALAKPERR